MPYMHAAEPLTHFVDDLLAYLYEAPDQRHARRRAPARRPARGLPAIGHRHPPRGAGRIRPSAGCHPRGLPAPAREGGPRDRRVEHPRPDVRTRRGPDVGAQPAPLREVLASSLAAQAIFTYAPETERARRILSKLRQVPRLIQAARENIKEPPAIFVKVGLDTWRGIKTFIDADLPRAFSGVDDLHLLSDLADASAEAVQAVGAYIEYLENDLRPRAKGTFRLGRDRFEQKLRLEEGIGIPVDRLLAVAMRELANTQEEFRVACRPHQRRRPDGGVAEGQRVAPGAGHPDRHREAPARRAADVPRAQPGRGPSPGDDIDVAATPGVLSLVVRQHVDAGAVRDPPSRAMYYLTDADASWPTSASASTCATSTCRRSGPSRSTRCIPATTCTTSTCAGSPRRCAAPRSSRRRRTSKAGRTTASR
jgi:hypothetical protein